MGASHEAVRPPFPEIGAHRPVADPYPILKTARGEAPPSKGRRGEGRPPETAPSPPVGSCDGPLALVNQGHPLPRGYVAGDLMSLSHYGIRTLRGDAALRRGRRKA